MTVPAPSVGPSDLLSSSTASTTTTTTTSSRSRSRPAWPPGFRFHPTDEELVLYYLKRKICGRRLLLDVISNLDVYKFEPAELPERSSLRSGDKQWYFFSPRDRKYPNGSRSNRATRRGYWKTTGKDRPILNNSRTVGSKKTLVFYEGRAPKGQRTDWVMHEYTVDDRELSNYSHVQDHYALYKLYRKSGPGPKNGEQYGAPYLDELWPDDDVDDEPIDNSLTDVTADGGNCLSAPLFIDGASLDDLLGDFPDNPQPAGHLEEFLQFDHEPEAESCIEAVSVEQNESSQPCLVGDDQTSLETSLITAPQMLALEVPDIIFAPDNLQPDTHRVEEDFLEMNDLGGSEPGTSTMENGSNYGHFNNIGEFYEPYVYFDAPMFLDGTLGQMGPMHLVSESSIEDENQYISSDLWVHEQRPPESNQAIQGPLASGEVYSDSATNPSGQAQMLAVHEAGGASRSWFSSTISSMLDSIPTRPAIASENPFISRALERVSSFRSGRVASTDSSTVGGNNGTTVVRRRAGDNRGFFFVSVLVGLCAVLWVLTVGTTVKVLKAFLGKYVPSQ